MDENLQLLINHYKEEQRLLQSLHDECLSHEDYRNAKHYLNNSRLLHTILFNLHSLSDYNYAEKEKVLNFISNIESFKKKFSDHFMTSFDQERLQKLNEKLSLLNEKPVIEVEEKYDIENAVIELLEKKINGFKLFVLKHYNLYLDFTLIETDIIHIEFTAYKNLFDRDSLRNLYNSATIIALYKKGFKLSADKNILYTNFNLANQSTKSIIIFLSLIFFEFIHWPPRKGLELVIY